MELKLDTENDRLDEVVKMELKNNGDNDVDTLYLRYYPNGYVPFLKDSFHCLIRSLFPPLRRQCAVTNSFFKP